MVSLDYLVYDFKFSVGLRYIYLVRKAVYETKEQSFNKLKLVNVDIINGPYDLIVEIIFDTMDDLKEKIKTKNTRF